MRPPYPLAAALALPVLAGIAWQALNDAPLAYLLVNAGALLLGLGLVAARGMLRSAALRTGLAAALLGLLTLPLLIGPDIAGVRRWVPLGPVMLNSGLLCGPALVMLAVERGVQGVWWIGGAMILAVLQPDAALVLALACAAAAIAASQRRWVPLLLALPACAFLPLVLQRGALPPVPFVERVLPAAWDSSPPMAAALAAALIGAAVLIAREPRLSPAGRTALLAAMAGFAAISLAAPYPAPLIGYGPAAILGLGLALGLGAAPTHAQQSLRAG